MEWSVDEGSILLTSSALSSVISRDCFLLFLGALLWAAGGL